MKRFILFIDMFLFTGRYLHQAYAYDNGGDGSLNVEIRIGKKNYVSDRPLYNSTCMASALWDIAGQAALDAARRDR